MDEKISQLSFNAPLTGSEILPIVQSGTNRKLRVSDIVATSTVLSVNGHIGVVSLNFTDVNAVGVGTNIGQLTNDVGYIIGNQTITLSGDASGSGKTSIAVTLASVVASGTYTKVTVDVKGRVTAGTTLIASDVPNLDFSKITTGKPTTLSGYGITDAQPLDGDLTSIASLAGTSGYAKKTGANTWVLDTNTYITGNQTITLSGDISGSGTTAITTAIGVNKVLDTMIRQSAGLSILGRSANTTGNVTDIIAVTSGHVLRYNGTSVGFGTITGSSLVLANGSGTTWNSTVYDLGGTLTNDFIINSDTVGNRYIGFGLSTAISGFQAFSQNVLNGEATDIATTGSGLILQYQKAGNTEAIKFNFSVSGLIYTDSFSTRLGIQYAASGYETTNLSLTSRGYVLGAKTYTDKQTFVAPTTSIASVNFPTGTAPTSPSNGDVWYSSNSLKARINGVTKDLGAGIIALSNGSGTTANGTSIDLGGTMSNSVFIESNVIGGQYFAIGTSVPVLGFQVQSQSVSNGEFTNIAINASAFNFRYTKAGGAQSNIFNLDISGTVFTDSFSTKSGIQYAASGYETSDLSLTSRGYVLSAKSYVGTQTFRTGSTVAGTSPIKFVSGSLMTVPELGAIEYNGTHLYATLTGPTRFQLDQQLGNNFMTFTGPTSSVKTFTLPDATATILTTAALVSIAQGGTGTATPGLIAGTNVTITGTWPNQTINASGGGGGITNSAANTELMMSNGTNAISSKVFVGTLGNLTLGDGSTAGDRIISVTSSTTNSNLTISPQGTGHVTIGGAILLSTALANDNALTQVMVRDSSTGTIKYRLASTLGFTNAAANTEFIVSDGTNGIASGIFNPSTSNIVLGSTGLTGNRQISAVNTASTANLTLSAQGHLLLDSNNIDFGTSTSNSVAFQAVGGTNVTVSFTSKGSGNFSWIDNGSTSAMTFIPTLGQLQIGKTSDNSAVYTANVGSNPLPDGGGVTIKGASGYSSGNGNGGAVTIQSGGKTGTGTADGNIVFNPLTGYVLLKNTTNSSFSISGASSYAAMFVNDVSGGGTNNAFQFHTSANQVIKLYTVNSGSNYTITNGTTDRTFDANATSIDELADIIFTLVSDLKLTGLIS